LPPRHCCSSPVISSAESFGVSTTPLGMDGPILSRSAAALSAPGGHRSSVFLSPFFDVLRVRATRWRFCQGGELDRQ
jgi:hypothetical protein